MDKIKLDSGDWVVVCDGRKAIILRNAGDAAYPNLKTEEVREHKAAPAHELGVSPPVRTHTAAVAGSTRRSSIEQTDWHEQEERTFLKELVGHLDKLLTAAKTAKLIMVAPPHAIGVLRKAYTPAVKSKLRAEIERDYVKLPLGEIEQRLFR
jgi:protein required for attachment to host cells